MRDALLRATAALVCRRPRTVVAIGLLLAVVSAAYAGLTLRMNANTDDLIGSDRPYFADYRRFLDEFGDLEHIYVVVVDDGRPERVRACVDEITRRLRDLGELPGVHGAIEPAEQTRLATRVMPEASLAGLADAAAALAVLRETDDARTVLADATARLERLTGTWTDLPPETQRRLGASAVLLLEVVAGTAGLAPPPPEPLRSDTGRLHFVIVEPEKDFSTLAVIEEPLARIRAELDAVRAAFPGLEIGLTGRPVLQADEMTTTTVDMTRASIIAVVIVSGLFMIVIGGVWRPVLAVVALMCGVAWTFGLAAVTVGQLNLLSIVFAIVLVGIGIDFGVHLVARFLEHRRGHDAEDAVVHTLRTAGRGNLTGAVTSSLAFFMAMFTSFQGLRELGFIAGAGLLLCLVSMSTVLPALLLLADARLGQPKAHGRRHALLEGHPRLLHRLPGLVLGLVAVATLAGLPALRALGFEENLLELQAEGLESVRWEHRILDDSVAATWFGAVTVDDLDAIGPVVGAARERPGIGAVRSVLDIVAPPSVRRAELRAALHAVPDDAAASSPPPLPDGRTWDAAGAVNAAEAALDRLIVLAAAGDRDDLRALAGLKRRLAALTTELASPDHDVTAAARALVAQRVADAHATAGELLAG
ncbi:MAG: MMPL family transporter, partial [Planctomycetota bacterium]